MLEDDIRQNIDITDPSEPRLRDSGVPVDALIGYYNAAGKDILRVARDYDLQVEDVQAALDYYWRHPAVINARLALNVS